MTSAALAATLPLPAPIAMNNALAPSPSQQVSIEWARRVSRRIKPSRPYDPMVQQDTAGTQAEEDGMEIWGNRLYTASVMRWEDGWPLGGGPWVKIGIHCQDGEARHDWREMQAIKNDIVGPDWEAVELFPAEARLVDPSNMYILWCCPRIPIGMEHRMVMTPENCIAPQRGWAKGEAPAA